MLNSNQHKAPVTGHTAGRPLRCAGPAAWRSRGRRSAMALACSALLTAGSAQAVNVVWAGGMGNWTTAGLWSGQLSGNAPGVNDAVFIDGGKPLASAVTLTGSGNAGTLSIDSGDSLGLGTGAYLQLRGGRIVNNGSLTVTGSTSSGSVGRLFLFADTTLSGSGETILGNAYGVIQGNGGLSTLTIASGHTLRGDGQLGSAAYGVIKVVNQGLVVADAIGPSSVLRYAGTAFDNSAGTVQVGAGAGFSSSGTFSGGSIVGSGSSSLGGSGIYQRVAISGGFALDSGTTFSDVVLTGSNAIGVGPTYAGGTLANNGSLTLAGNTSTGSQARLSLVADTTLAGGGETVLANRYATIDGGGDARTLTIAAGHTLRGAGNLGSSTYGAVNVVNQGRVVADVLGSSSTLSFRGTTFDNTAGTVQVAAGASFSGSGTFSGGSIVGSGSSSLGGNGRYQGVTLSGGLALTGGTFSDVLLQDTNTVGAGVVYADGLLTNSGSLTLAGNTSTGAQARLTLAADTTLAGSGVTLLANAYSTIDGGGVVRTLTIAADHTLRGSGDLGNSTYGAINVINRGLVRAESLDGAAGLSFYNGSFDNTAGTVQVAADTQFSISGSFTGGVLQGSGSSALSGGGTLDGVLIQGGFALGGGLTLRDVTVTGSNTVGTGTGIRSQGTITNNGTLSLVGNTSTGTAARLTLAADTTLAGTGQTVLANLYANFGGGSTAPTLTIAAGHTLRGSGNLGSGTYGVIGLVNQGHLIADSSSPLRLAVSNFDNRGVLTVQADATLDASGETLHQTTANAVTTVNGTLKATLFDLAAGTLNGSGTLQGSVSAGAGSTIAAGNSPGKLSITGNLTLADGSSIVVDAFGLTRGTQYDWLAVTGNAALGGTVLFDFGSFEPAIGNSFAFLTTQTGVVSGSFDAVTAAGYTLAVNHGLHDVTVTVTGVSPVPEPETWALFAAGLLATAWAARRRVGGGCGPAVQP